MYTAYAYQQVTPDMVLMIMFHFMHTSFRPEEAARKSTGPFAVIKLFIATGNVI